MIQLHELWPNVFTEKIPEGFIWAHDVRCLMASRDLSPWWQESVVEGGTSHLGGQEATKKGPRKLCP